MGIIFSNKAQKVQIKSLLNTENEYILSRLQAGRVPTRYGSAPYRLSKVELNKLKDEYILIEDNGECVYATFVKPVNEIRQMLGLPIQSENPFDIF